MTDDKWPGECSNHEHSPGHIYARSVQIMYTHPVTLMLKFGISIRSATNRLFFRILVALFADFKPVITGLLKSGTTFDKCGTNVDKCGSTFSKNRSTWHKKGSIPGECPVHVHSPGHNDIIVEIYKSFICRN